MFLVINDDERRKTMPVLVHRKKILYCVLCCMVVQFLAQYGFSFVKPGFAVLLLTACSYQTALLTLRCVTMMQASVTINQITN